MPKKSWIQGENSFWQSAAMNNRTYIQCFERLKNIAITRFKWNDLPDTMDERFIELTLFGDARITFFEDEVLGYLSLPFSNDSTLDVYNNPTKWRAYANNGYQKELDKSNAVICWNNKLRTNSVLAIEQYAYRLYQLERALDTNVNAQKTPIMIRCDENQRLVLKNLYMKYDGNQPFIFGDKDLDLRGITVLNTGAPYLVDRLQAAKERVWNEALAYLGIANVSAEKKERMIVSEVENGMGGTMASRFSGLEMRQKAADEFNKMFGTNISVQFNDADNIDIAGVDETDGEGTEIQAKVGEQSE